MEAALPALQPAAPPPSAEPPARKAASAPKPRCARRKTLCDITNLGPHAPVAEEPARSDSADGGAAQLVKENADLVRRLADRDGIIELNNSEIQKLRVANWELARATSQMMAELNLGRNRLKALEHELACSRASLKAKTSELEEAKKTMRQQRCSSRSAQIKDVVIIDPKPPSDAAGTKRQERASDTAGAKRPEPGSDAANARMPGDGSRKRMMRSRSLGPVASVKLEAPKEKETTQRRKSVRIPQPSCRTEDLFEIEDVQLAIGSCKTDSESASGSDKPGHQFLRRSSLGRPLRQARERVATYKEMPVNVKLRRP